MRITARNQLLLLGTLLLAAAPAFAQSVRIISQGTAYAVADQREGTELKVDRVVGAPVAGGAQVVFFRPGGATGTTTLSESGKAFAELPGDSYATASVAPGVYTFAVDGRPLQLQLAAGERRYVRVVEGQAGPQLAPSHAPVFMRVSLGTRLSQL